MSPARDERIVATAWDRGGVVLGYDIHGDPWLWPDQVRVMQGIVLGMTGSGQTTLLNNIITQDLMRRMGPPDDRHKIPIVIFDGKGDLEFFQELLPYIHRAGRLDDLRLISPARPELSSLYNPFYTEDDCYMAQLILPAWRAPGTTRPDRRHSLHLRTLPCRRRPSRSSRFHPAPPPRRR
jgi:hypothetical protein